MVELCPVCQFQVGGGCVEIDGKKLHPHCFFCSKCAKQLRMTNMKVENGKYSCQDCSGRTGGSHAVQALCPTCKFPVTGGQIEIDGKHYHPKCFFCSKCAKEMRLGNAQADGKGKYCCVDCGGRTASAHEILPVCPVCKFAVNGGSIEIDEKVYHPKCFFCSKCAKEMRLANSQSDGKGKYCCIDCGGRTGASHEILPVCPVCKFAINGGHVVANEKTLHAKCFFCAQCAKQCRLTHYQTVNDKFYCQDCVDKNPTLYQAVRRKSKVPDEK